jgi:hypothetical protein
LKLFGQFCGEDGVVGIGFGQFLNRQRSKLIERILNRGFFGLEFGRGFIVRDLLFRRRFSIFSAATCSEVLTGVSFGLLASLTDLMHRFS